MSKLETENIKKLLFQFWEYKFFTKQKNNKIRSQYIRKISSSTIVTFKWTHC